MTTRAKPKRIQRQRTKGFRLPEGCVYVGRPTIYGNPYWHEQKFHGIDIALALYRETVQGCWNPSLIEEGRKQGLFPRTYETHCEWLKAFRKAGWMRNPLEVIRSELRGKDLACWCKLDAPCHADVLLELANS